MDGITLIIALVALIIAIIAFQRTGGIKKLRQDVDNLNPRTEFVRDRTANLLNRFERAVRGKDKEPAERDKRNEPDTFNKPK